MTPEQHARAKEIFAAALPLPATARSAMLTALSQTEPEISAEVQSLLQHHLAETILAPHVTSPAAPMDTGTARASDTSPFDAPREHRSDDGQHARPSIGKSILHRLGPAGQFWLGVTLACVLLGVAGYITEVTKRSAVRELRSSSLHGSLQATVRALELWMEHEQRRVAFVSAHPDVRPLVADLLTLADRESTASQLTSVPAQTRLREQMHDLFGPKVRYAIWNRQHVTVADWSPQGTGIGEGATPYGASLLTRVFTGETVMQFPGVRPAITRNYPLTTSGQSLGIFIPLRDEQDRVVAAMLIYGLGAEDRFREILAIVRIGASGETFAFDKSALLISKSRFEKELTELQLVEASSSSLHEHRMISLRDPGRKLTAAQPARSSSKTWPLTKMARHAIAGEDGMDLDGYRSYRGTLVIGAWKWLAAYEIGVATEIELDEVRSQLRPIQFDTSVLLGLLGTSLLAVLLSWRTLRRLRRQLSQLEHVGPYTLEEKIGEGGMGVVYRARHSFLKRPTAIKFLKPDGAMPSRARLWFEREARLASQLTHPNTITIFDYGVTPDGVCYYVMEFLDGLNLEQVVRQHGPLPPRRVVHILQQVCGSLREAHALGMIHRDIKPHNIMVCGAGGETDFVKVLDFGLVKTFDTTTDPNHPPAKSPSQPVSTILAGTPVYMAPERFTSLQASDPRIDIYALGGVAFFLLAGREIFEPRDDRSLLDQILHTEADSVAALLPQSTPSPLVELIRSCLEKSPEQRPSDIQSMIDVLSTLAASFGQS